ncbi:MAG: hypothetical protein ACMVY4_11500 [Minwuia sp.]|uniref:hypothetical protein n=1 Tax=Minwuia sp. TaxID=2493630 RepID=UPI003A845653
MRIVRSENVVTAEGQATIGVIGSCRVHGPVHSLIGQGEAELVAFPFNAYMHSPLEAKQYIEYCLGRRFVQPALSPYIFGRDQIRPTTEQFAELVAGLDVIVVEISALARLTACGLEVQNNYFSTNFVRSGGKPYLDWWRTVATESPDRESVAHELVERSRTESSGPAELWRDELILTARMKEMDKDAFSEAMDRLVETHPARFLFVSHFNLPEPRAIDARAKVIELTSRHTRQSGDAFFDPSALIAEVGPKKALKADGKDIFHYAAEFEFLLGQELMSRCQAALLEPLPVRAGAELAPAAQSPEIGRPGKLYELDLPGLRRLAQDEAGNATEVKDLIHRRILELDPLDGASAAALATISLERGFPESALVYANDLLRRDPANAAARHIRLQAHAAIGDGDMERHLDEAIENGDRKAMIELSNAIRRKFPVGAPLRDRVNRLVADAARRASDLSEAGRGADAFRLMLDLADWDTANSRDWRLRAQAEHRRALRRLREMDWNRCPDEARQLARAMIDANISVFTAHETLGRLELTEGNLEKAADAFLECIRLEPGTPLPYLNLARTRIRQGDVTGAARAHLELVRRAEDPAFKDMADEARKSLRGLAASLVSEGRRIEAGSSRIDDLWEAHTCYRLAAAEIEENDKLQQWTAGLKRKALIEALRLDRENPEAFEAGARTYLRMEPDNTRILVMLAQQLSRARRHEEALELWQRLVGLEPQNAIFPLQVARCYDWLGMVEPMRRAAARALELDPGLEPAAMLLAKAPEPELDPESPE